VKTFSCDSCGALAFFENFRCASCGSTLAYLPEKNALTAIRADKKGVFRSPDGGAYRLCQNSVDYNVCNEAVPADSTSSLCSSCCLTEIVPDLTSGENRELWYQLELSKRRLIFSLRTLGLMPPPKSEDPDKGLSFHFLANLDGSVMTGHDSGVITIALAEADDAVREKLRQELGEPYRALIGHLRHEVGHYFWDRLVLDGNKTESFRALFGDERKDYSEALKKHYGKPDDGSWKESYISHYAESHPWEDWAETFAHYLYIRDLTETAASVGLLQGDEEVVEMPFDELLDHWFRIVLQLNELGKSAGAGSLYPFVLNAGVREKLGYIDLLMRPGKSS
jgi:hypothetical protein